MDSYGRRGYNMTWIYAIVAALLCVVLTFVLSKVVKKKEDGRNSWKQKQKKESQIVIIYNLRFLFCGFFIALFCICRRCVKSFRFLFVPVCS